MLTGLWKIDEQASAVVMELFYKNLVAGMPKDEALRQAKLDYLQKADGRALAPQFWAGLVIMGDASPIALQAVSPFRVGLLAIGSLLFFVAIAMFVWRSKRKRSARQQKVTGLA